MPSSHARRCSPFGVETSGLFASYTFSSDILPSLSPPAAVAGKQLLKKRLVTTVFSEQGSVIVNMIDTLGIVSVAYFVTHFCGTLTS